MQQEYVHYARYIHGKEFGFHEGMETEELFYVEI